MAPTVTPDFAAATFFIRCLAAQLFEYEGQAELPDDGD